jgi:hypothetical protein
MSHFGKTVFDVVSDIPDLSGKVFLVTGGQFNLLPQIEHRVTDN